MAPVMLKEEGLVPCEVTSAKATPTKGRRAGLSDMPSAEGVPGRQEGKRRRRSKSEGVHGEPWGRESREGS